MSSATRSVRLRIPTKPATALEGFRLLIPIDAGLGRKGAKVGWMMNGRRRLERCPLAAGTLNSDGLPRQALHSRCRFTVRVVHFARPLLLLARPNTVMAASQ